MDNIRIIIADDHWMVRDGLRQLLELDESFRVVAEASSGEECKKILHKVEADILLLDINLQDMNGLQLVKQIREQKNNIKIIILTIHNEPEYMNKAFAYGSDGYVLKDSDSDVLVRAIKEVLLGKQFIDPTMAPYYYVNHNPAPVNEVLTDREIEVLILMSQGLYNKEIGYQLGISEKTVKNHASNIFRKINVSDRTQAAIYAINNNYISI